MSTDKGRAEDRAKIRQGSILFDIQTGATTDRVRRFIYYCKMYGAMLGELGRPTMSAVFVAQ